LSLGYTFNWGPVSITPSLYVFNLLDRQGVTDINEDFNGNGTFCEDTAGCGTNVNPATGEPWMTQRNFDRLGTVSYGQPLPNEEWARPSARQEARQIRAALKLSF
jgi:hypothetical protein